MADGFDSTQEHPARRRGAAFDRLKFATRRRVAERVDDIEAQAALKRQLTDTPVKGPAAIRAQEPQAASGGSKPWPPASTELSVFLHDGRTATISDAIQRHNVQASSAWRHLGGTRWGPGTHWDRALKGYLLRSVYAKPLLKSLSDRFLDCLTEPPVASEHD